MCNFGTVDNTNCPSEENVNDVDMEPANQADGMFINLSCKILIILYQ